MGKRKQFAVAAIVLVILLAWILMWYNVIFKHSVEVFNATEHSTLTDDYDVAAAIAPRGGSTDSWDKIMDDDTLQGTIYEMTVTNNTDYEISDWSEKIEFSQDCYINNGWCGVFEIHQFGSGSEVVQTVDLRNYAESDLQLAYVKADQDNLIELHSGDYVVYKPSAEVYEMPLAANGGSTTVGVIFYTAKDVELDLSASSTGYFFNRGYEQGSEHRIYMSLLIAWIVAAVAFLSMLIYDIFSRKALELREKRLEESMSIFSGFVDAKDPYTNGHTKRVAEYAVALAKEVGYSGDKLQDLYYTGLMHDCGKCYVPDEILKKPGSLTDEEYAIIKQHTVKGAELLGNFTSIDGIKDGALCHHERYDGKGYPNGLKGKEIPEVGRILAIADAFDAMNSKRCYRDALTKEHIREELEKGSGKQFDPELLPIFIKLLDEGKLEDKDNLSVAKR